MSKTSISGAMGDGAHSIAEILRDKIIAGGGNPNNSYNIAELIGMLPDGGGGNEPYILTGTGNELVESPPEMMALCNGPSVNCQAVLKVSFTDQSSQERTDEIPLMLQIDSVDFLLGFGGRGYDQEGGVQNASHAFFSIVDNGPKIKLSEFYYYPDKYGSDYSYETLTIDDSVHWEIRAYITEE